MTEDVMNGMTLNFFKMEENDIIEWEIFRQEVTTTLNKKQFEFVCDLHSRLFKHSYYKPCTCSPKTIKNWIAQINNVYEENYNDKQI